MNRQHSHWLQCHCRACAFFSCYPALLHPSYCMHPTPHEDASAIRTGPSSLHRSRFFDHGSSPSTLLALFFSSSLACSRSWSTITRFILKPSSSSRQSPQHQHGCQGRAQCLLSQGDSRALLSRWCRKSKHASRQNLLLLFHGRLSASIRLCRSSQHKLVTVVPGQCCGVHSHGRRYCLPLRSRDNCFDWC